MDIKLHHRKAATILIPRWTEPIIQSIGKPRPHNKILPTPKKFHIPTPQPKILNRPSNLQQPIKERIISRRTRQLQIQPLKQIFPLKLIQKMFWRIQKLKSKIFYQTSKLKLKLNFLTRLKFKMFCRLCSMQTPKLCYLRKIPKIPAKLI